jgi:hypothetical protein
MWREHAVESARVLNAIGRISSGLRSLRVPDRIPLHQHVVSGAFRLLGDDEVAAEIRLFIETLEGIDSYLASDHIMNLLQDVEGRLPGDKAMMLQRIDAYLHLDDQTRLRYRLGRRMGLLAGVGDLERTDLMKQVDATMARLLVQHPRGLSRFCTNWPTG